MFGNQKHVRSNSLRGRDEGNHMVTEGDGDSTISTAGVTKMLDHFKPSDLLGTLVDFLTDLPSERYRNPCKPATTWGTENAGIPAKLWFKRLYDHHRNSA